MSERWELVITRGFGPIVWDCNLRTATWEAGWQFLDPVPRPPAEELIQTGIKIADDRFPANRLRELLWFLRMDETARIEAVGLSRDLCPDCADCRGSGKYVGFAIIEACQSCAGRGIVPPAELVGAPVIRP
jgi:hypothetical protein